MVEHLRRMLRSVRESIGQSVAYGLDVNDPLVKHEVSLGLALECALRAAQERDRYLQTLDPRRSEYDRPSGQN